MKTRKIIQIDLSSEKIIAEYADAKSACAAVKKPNGFANIMLACGYNHLENSNARKAYGFYWRFSN